MVLCSSCSFSIYKSADFTNVAGLHKTLIILPARITLNLRPNRMKNTKREQHQYYTVDFQNAAKTNALLEKAGMNYSDLYLKSKNGREDREW